MKALVCNQYRKLSLQNILVPEPTDNQVCIAVKYAGICCSDRHILDNDIALNTKLPVVLGHELSGIVDKVGKNVYGISIGDPVSTESTFWNCNKCLPCLTGSYNQCSTRKIAGYTHDGAFEEYIIMPAERIHKLDSISLLQGAILEPLACCVHGICEQIAVRKSDVCVIGGVGTIGLLTAMVLHERKLILYGRPQTSKIRYSVAHSLNPYLVTTNATIVEDVMKATNGFGADIFVECSGSLEAVNDGLKLLRRGGTFLQLGLQSKTDNTVVDWSQVAYKMLNVTGSIGSKHSSWELAKRMVREKYVRPELIVSQPFFALEDFQDAFKRAQDGVGVKTIFKIG